MDSTSPSIDTGHPPGSWRELVQVAWPLVISAGSFSLMFVADRIFLTWYSTDAMAAAGASGVLHWTVIALFLGTAMYVNTFVAQYDGAKQPRRVGAALWQGVYFAIAAGLLVAAVAPFSDRIFAALGHAANVQRLESEYFSLLCYGTPPMLLSAALSCYFSGRGRTMAIMWVNLLSTGTDLVLDYPMIHGWGPFPELGIRGAAITNVIGSFVAVTAYLLLMLRDVEGRRYGLWTEWRFDGALFRRLLKFGMPSGINFLIDGVCFTLFIQLVGRIGEQELAATNLAFVLNMLVFVPILGLNTAIMTLTGQRIGEGRPDLAVRTTWVAFGIAEAYTLCFALVYVLRPEWFLAICRWQADVADFQPLERHVVVLLRFVAVYSLFDVMTVTFGAALRGAGDTRFVLVYSLLAGFYLMVLPTYLAIEYGGGMIGAWWAVTAFIVTLGVGFFLRFQGGKWKQMRVIETAAEETDPELAEAAV